MDRSLNGVVEFHGGLWWLHGDRRCCYYLTYRTPTVICYKPAYLHIENLFCVMICSLKPTLNSPQSGPLTLKHFESLGSLCKERNFYGRIMASNFCGIIAILFECTGHKLVSDWFPTMTISSSPPVVTDWQCRSVIGNLLWLAVGELCDWKLALIFGLHHEA
jgi:hypothetical protein